MLSEDDKLKLKEMKEDMEEYWDRISPEARHRFATEDYQEVVDSLSPRDSRRFNEYVSLLIAIDAMTSYEEKILTPSHST